MITARQARMTTNGSLLICGLPAKPRGVILSRMKLRLVVEHDPQTKRWAAFFPELPGCASAGDTEEEAVRNAKEALELWFEPTPVRLSAGAKVLEVALTCANASLFAPPKRSFASCGGTDSC